MAAPWYSRRTRVGPYRRFHDLLIDAYGDEGEDYPITMDKRASRMERITVDVVMAKVAVWKATYTSIKSTSAG